MEKVGFDKVQIDPMGNILGYMGTGKTLIGFDAHIDTVGIGNIKNWEFDPYEGFESDEESADVEHLTRWAVLFLQYTVLRS